MSNIGTSVAMSKMGFNITRSEEFKARVAALKKIGDLSYKPSDAQKRAILAGELKKAENSAPALKPAPAPKPVRMAKHTHGLEAPKTDAVAEMRAKKIAEAKASVALRKRLEEEGATKASRKPSDFSVGKKFKATDGEYEVVAKEHNLPKKAGDSFYAKSTGLSSGSTTRKNAQKFVLMDFGDSLYLVKAKKAEMAVDKNWYEDSLDDRSSDVWDTVNDKPKYKSYAEFKKAKTHHGYGSGKSRSDLQHYVQVAMIKE